MDGAVGSLGIPSSALTAGLPTTYSNDVSNEGWAGLCAARQVRHPSICRHGYIR